MAASWPLVGLTSYWLDGQRATPVANKQEKTEDKSISTTTARIADHPKLDQHLTSYRLAGLSGTSASCQLLPVARNTRTRTSKEACRPVAFQSHGVINLRHFGLQS
jgi:hypothetical protein